MLLKQPVLWNVTQFLPNELKFNGTRRCKKDDLSEQVPGFLSGGLTVLIRGEASMLSAWIRKMFQLCMFIGDFIWRNAQKLYKVTISKGDICKHEKSMLNVSGMFFIASRVS